MGTLHVVGAAYCPLLPQVSTWLPLQTDVFGVHALHCPAPLHVPPEHVVPCALAVKPHTPLVHTACKHAFVDAGQFAAVMHSTHAPAVQSAVGEAHAELPTQSPALQLCGTFVPGRHRVCPAVHSVHVPDWHVPVSLPTAQRVPSVRAETAHALPVQAAWRQGFEGAAHCATDVHCTQFAELFSQYGVLPPQLDGESYWPFALQLSTWFPLHTFVPGLHALHTPEALHVPPGHVVPCGLAT